MIYSAKSGHKRTIVLLASIVSVTLMAYVFIKFNRINNTATDSTSRLVAEYDDHKLTPTEINKLNHVISKAKNVLDKNMYSDYAQVNAKPSVYYDSRNNFYVVLLKFGEDSQFDDAHIVICKILVFDDGITLYRGFIEIHNDNNQPRP